MSIALVAFSALSLVGCSETTHSPVGPVGLTSKTAVEGSSVQNDFANPGKKGGIVHRVEGSGLLLLGGKNLGARYSAHEYADGTFDGEYEINSANATGDPTMKANGKVLKFKIYEGAGQYGGKMAVFLGQEKTNVYAGCFDLFFAIDNGTPGQSSSPDQVNHALVTWPSLDSQIMDTGLTIEDIYAMSPADIINLLGTMDCDKGNITVE